MGDESRFHPESDLEMAFRIAIVANLILEVSDDRVSRVASSNSYPHSRLRRAALAIFADEGEIVVFEMFSLAVGW
jgi:hypothetical protein